jgi:branched-subunit amino acid ABC-type transport system permease component
MVDVSLLFGQFLGGLTTAMFLFLIASGLSLVFGVMRVLNFAHGSFYMIGAYLAWQAVQWFAPLLHSFWLAALVAALGVALLGGLVERLLLRRIYGREELYQLLLTYALVLILGDVAKAVWGTQQLSVSRPPILSGGFEMLGVTLPAYNLFIMVVGVAIAVTGWLVLTRSPAGRMVRAAALDREMLGALGANVGALYTGMFVVSSFLAGLSGALVTPIQSIVPGMDVEIIVEAFIVVVIGGLGSFWGTFWGSVIYGQVLSFGILILPSFSLFSVFALMAVILIVRPWACSGDRSDEAAARHGTAPAHPVDAHRLCRGADHPVDRLALRYFPGDTNRDQRAVCRKSQPFARHHRPRLVRSRRLFRHRVLRVRHPDEDLCDAVHHRAAGRGDRRRSRRAGVRLFLRSPYQDLLRHADAGLLADHLGDLLQME